MLIFFLLLFFKCLQTEKVLFFIRMLSIMELQEMLRKKFPLNYSLMVLLMSPLSHGSNGRRKESWLKSVQRRYRAPFTASTMG